MLTPPQLRPTLIAVAAALTFIAGHAQANTNYYLKLGDIKGPSVVEGDKYWHPIDAFSWSISIPGWSGGGGSGAGTPILSDLFWSQPFSSSMPKLFETAAKGTHLDTVKLRATTQINGQERTFFEMLFGEAIITHLHLTGSTGAPPYLQGSFNYQTITMNYFTLDSNGKEFGSPLTGTYDLSKVTGSLASLSVAYSMGMMGPTITTAVPE